MIIFPVFPVVFCLWALLLTSGQIYTPILTIPALISPVHTPLLSPLDGYTILILSEVCVGTVSITFPTCDPVDAPVPTPSSTVALSPQRAFQFVAGLLVLGCAGIVLHAKGAIRLVNGAGPTTPTPSDYPAHPPSSSPPLPSFPPIPREAGPGTNWTPLSQSAAPGSLYRQVLTRKIGVSTSGRKIRPSPADSGYEGSPLLSRRAASKQHQSRLRVVTNADVDSPTPSGPLPTFELGSGGSGGYDASLEGPSSTPLFNPPVHQGSEGGWTSYVVADDLFWAAGFTKRDSTPSNLLGKVGANLETPSEETPPLSPFPLKNRIPSSTGFSSVPGVTTPVPVERTGVSDRKSAREARDAFLYLQAERGYAAPSRLYYTFVNESSTPSPARSPNIQALRDILESGKATLRRLNEKRSAWRLSTDIRSRSLSRPSIVEERAFSTIPISAASRTSFESLEQGPINLEERISAFDLPAGISALVDGEMAFHGDEDGPSYPAPPFETALANLRKRKSASVAKTLDVPASTSADIGLRLLTQAMDEWRERSLYLDSEASFEATVSVDLTLGEVPSFLNDTLDLSVSHPSQSVVVTQDQGIQPTPPFPAPAVDAASPDVLSEDTPIASNSPLSPLHRNPTPSPSAPPLETSQSFRRIDGFLKDILGTPVHQFSRPTPTFEAYDTRDLTPTSSLDDLKIVEDLPWLMDQIAPPSPIESRSGSPIPPFEEVISRVRARKAVAAAQKNQVTGFMRDPEIVSTGAPGRLETSMSLGRIADFICDIWASPVHKFSNGIRFEGSPGVNPSTSSASAICIPEDMSYLVDQRIPNALVESLSGPVTSVPSFKNLLGMGLPHGVLSTESKFRSVLDLDSPYASGPFSASPVSSRPSSGSSGSSLTMEIPENMTLLCEESLADLDAVDGSWC